MPVKTGRKLPRARVDAKVAQAAVRLARHVPGAAAAFGAEDDAILAGLAAFERDRPVLDMEKDVRHDITARRRVVFASTLHR